MQNEGNEIKLEESDNLLVKDANKKKLNLIEIILLNYGYSYNTWKMFFIVFFFLINQSIHFTYFGNLITPIKNYYNLTDTEISLYSSIMPIGVFIGSFSLGYILKFFKRTNLIIFGQLTIAIMHLIIGIFDNLLIFNIMRFFIGILLGIISPIILNILTEYLPILFRGFMMLLVSTGFSLGKLLMPLIMFWLMPNMETANYPKISLASTFFSCFSFILTLLFIKDSPRNLILTNNINEGISILEELNNKPLNMEEKELIINQVKSGINKNINSSYADLFSPDYFKSTVLLSFIQFSYFFIITGTYLVYSLTIKEIKPMNITNNEVILKQIFVNIINLFSHVFTGLLLENSYLGRIKSLILCSILGIITLIISIVYSDQFHLFIGIFYFILGPSISVINTYVSELYPTKIRDITLGYIISCGQIGEIISQLIFIYLHNSGIWIPYYTSISFIVTNIVLLISLPIETYSRSLDLASKENYNTDN